MTGRVVIVTGSSGGLGFEVARYLCEGGNDVIMACRNEEKTNRAIEKIKRLHPSALATYMHVSRKALPRVPGGSLAFCHEAYAIVVSCSDLSGKGAA